MNAQVERFETGCSAPLISPVPADRLEELVALYAQGMGPERPAARQLAAQLACDVSVGALAEDGRLVGFGTLTGGPDWPVAEVIVDRYASPPGLTWRLLQALTHPELVLAGTPDAVASTRVC